MRKVEVLNFQNGVFKDKTVKTIYTDKQKTNFRISAKLNRSKTIPSFRVDNMVH